MSGARAVTPAAITGAAARIASLLDEVADPAAAAVGTWSIREVAAHLATVSDLYPRYARGEGSPVASVDDLAAVNERMLTEVVDRSLADLAGLLRAHIADFVATVAAIDGDPVIPWIGGIPITVSALRSIVLAELLVHGYDIATAAGRPWAIARDDALAVGEGLLGVIPHYLDPVAAARLDACIELRLRGGPTWFMRFDGPRLTVHAAAPARVDCHVSADPATFLLVGFGRKGPVAAAATGKVVAWGRRPWLALTLPRVLRNP